MVSRGWSSARIRSLRTEDWLLLIILPPVYFILRPYSTVSLSPPPAASLKGPTRSTWLEEQGPGSRHTSVGVLGVTGLRDTAQFPSPISVCCSLIHTALYYNAQMDTEEEPSKSDLGTVPACSVTIQQCVCGLQWLHSGATRCHYELLETRTPRQELWLHGGGRRAYPTVVQSYPVVPNDWWQWQHQWDSRSHQLLQ